MPAKAPSMGPRSNDRGIAEVSDTRKIANGLQWGRDRMIAELMCGRDFTETASVLQWGRDRMIAELGGLRYDGTMAIILQWGRDRMIAELRRAGWADTRLVLPSMGPRSNDRGIER